MSVREGVISNFLKAKKVKKQNLTLIGKNQNQNL